MFPQGDVSSVDKIERLLKIAGGKPKECDLKDYSKGGTGKAKPEYIITFNDDISTIIVIECKNSPAKHRSENLNKPNAYAVDGVLYYAKFLKEEYNVIAVAVSGVSVNNIELVKGNRLRKAYSLDDIRSTAIDMHNYLREIKITEAHKPIFIAGILIALNDPDFAKSYSALTSYKSVMQNIQNTIENVLKDSDIRSSRINYIKQVFNTLQENTKFAGIPLGHFKSITWYIEQLEMKINPPYSQKDVSELEFAEHLLEILTVGGIGVVVVPMSCAIGIKFKDVRERLLKRHTLKAVFSMPDEIFYPTAINVCVMVWEAHNPHNPEVETFFGYCKNDGFEKRKYVGRIDVNDKWNAIKNEWLCEAYMRVDFSKMTKE